MTKTKKSVAQIKRNASLGGLIFGTVLVAAWTIAAAVMLVSFGLWGWVVWPAAVMFFIQRFLAGLATHLNQLADVKSEEDPIGALYDLLKK